MSGSSPAPSKPITHRDAIQKAANEDRMLQGNSKSLFGLSSRSYLQSSPGPFHEIGPEFTSIDLTASTEQPPLHTPGSPDPPKRVTERVVNNEFDLSLVGDLTMDPFLDVKPIAPLAKFPSRDGRGMQDDESLLFTLPLCTSTPPRSRRGGKGHRRGALVTISQLERLNETRSSVEINSLSSPTKNESVIETPSARRQRTLSLRRSVAFGIFDSPPPAWSTPKRHAPSIIVLGSSPGSSSSPDPSLRPTTPLRIVKRNKIRSSTTSEVSKAVISAVRDAFVGTREEHEDDAAPDPRDILCRASVWTCHTLPVGYSSSDISIYEDDEAEDEYTQESGEQGPATPPPPYAFSGLNTMVSVADGLKADTIKAFLDMKRCSIYSDDSTEIGYLAAAPGSALASVDSCLDDLLASFENLMTAMPELQPFAAKAQTAKLLSVASREQTSLPAT
ncbi:hypothetical protein C0992_003624 [Termitomyces sp. T32_za158]|nr:hypothetical protein C0992_003624 [Termitomyces sp. T32_za158]